MPAKLQSNKGQALVEILVALSIILFGILGVYGLAARAISLNRVNSDRYVATYLASEGIEVVKNIIDANVLQKKVWNDGLANGNYEVDYDDQALQANQERTLSYDEASGLYGYGPGRATTFRRLVAIETLGGGEELRVNSKINWRSRGGNFDLNLEDHFFNSLQ